MHSSGTKILTLAAVLAALAWSGVRPYDRATWLMEAVREILSRGRYVRGRGMLAFVVVCIVLAVSASYELIEWGAALALGQGADEFLGTQGDPWDTQSDMAFALLGALATLAPLARLHDRQMARLGPQSAGSRV